MKAASLAPCFGDKWAVIRGEVIIWTEASHEMCFFLDKASDIFSILINHEHVYVHVPGQG